MSLNLLPKGRTIYFNESLHKYTDDMDNEYTSMTTLISKYKAPFEEEKIAIACERIGANPRHPKYNKYKGKKAYDILQEWRNEGKIGADKGSVKHDYLESIIKKSTGYNLDSNYKIIDRLYTMDDIIRKHSYGELNLTFFINSGIATRYPIIYTIIESFVNNGFRIYAEIGVYDSNYLISGTIDLLLVKDNKFIILDWKTNKVPIRFESGYFEKDLKGNITDKFIFNNDNFKHPISHLPSSMGNIYSLQLTGYAYLVETFGFKNSGIILCHIREVDGVEIVTPIRIPYLKSEFKNMMIDHYFNRDTKTQKKIKY